MRPYANSPVILSQHNSSWNRNRRTTRYPDASRQRSCPWLSSPYSVLPSVAPPTTMSNPAQPFESSRRTTMYGRQPEELHIPSSSGLGYSNSHRQSMSHEIHPPPDLGANHVPAINVHQPVNTVQYGAGNPGVVSGAPVPGALQPGNPPPPMTVNTAPSMLPTLPQLSTQFPPPQPQQQQQGPTTPRSSISMSNSHAYSSSSPSNYDQSRYRQHGISDPSKYASPPGSGFQPQTPLGPKYSPLGLADIRPPPDLLGDVLASPGGQQANNGDIQVPTNSNYIAPWPIYAVDWCKWPLSGSNYFGGKIALGSYLEDNHNYVCLHAPVCHWFC